MASQQTIQRTIHVPEDLWMSFREKWHGAGTRKNASERLAELMAADLKRGGKDDKNF